MSIFQLDENLNDADFAKECEDESKAQKISDLLIMRFPRRLKGQDDVVVLSSLLGLGRTILTKDRAIAQDGIAGIPDEHPGIIIVANVPSVDTTGNEAVKKILGRMKKSFGRWHELPFKNSIIEITQVGIEIRKKKDAKPKYLDTTVSGSGWESQVVTILNENAGQICDPK